jgi:hypothetical protein
MQEEIQAILKDPAASADEERCAEFNDRSSPEDGDGSGVA